MNKTKEDRVLEFPFSDSFLPTWELWKEYKKAEWKFKYKSVISEQAAINLLSRLSDKNEMLAADIIRQSMENGWQGLFALKNNFNGTYRKGAQSPTAGGQDPTRINKEGFGRI